MITCDKCNKEFAPEPEVTFIGSGGAFKGEPETECSPCQHLVCLCEDCYKEEKREKPKCNHKNIRAIALLSDPPQMKKKCIDCDKEMKTFEEWKKGLIFCGKKI